MITFNAIGVVSFTRKEIKTKRTWWQHVLKWCRNEVDIPVYHYDLTIHTKENNMLITDIVVTEHPISFIILEVLSGHPVSTVVMRSIYPTERWLTFSDFKNANYAVFSRAQREGY